MKKTTRTLLSLIVVLMLGLGACANQVTPVSDGTAPIPIPEEGVVAEGHLVPERDATLAFQGAGTVVEVSVGVGDKVREGELLARIGSETDSAYAAAQLELVSAQQALDDLNDNEDEVRAQALITQNEAEDAYDDAQDYYEKLFEPYDYYKIVFQKFRTPRGVRRFPTIKKVKLDKADDETIEDADADRAPLDLLNQQEHEEPAIHDG